MPKMIDPRLRARCVRLVREHQLECPTQTADVIAARTYRHWKHPARITAQTVTDALVEDKIRDLAWATNSVTGQIQMTPEGLSGRRKWTALLRRQDGLAGTSHGGWTGRCGTSASRASDGRRSRTPQSPTQAGSAPLTS